MANRFRKLPPRIKPRRKTRGVSKPPPSRQASETSWLSPAGTVAGFERLADAVAHQPARHKWLRRMVVALFGTLLLGAFAAGVFNEIRG